VAGLIRFVPTLIRIETPDGADSRGDAERRAAPRLPSAEGAAMRIVEFTYRYQARATAPKRPPRNASAAQRRLDGGNRSFATLIGGMRAGEGTVRRVVEVDPADVGLAPRRAVRARQHPFAAILGCADARVPIELIFNEGPNDLFVVRVAGNGPGGDVMGSLHYAVDSLKRSLKAIVVLGHSGCGALTAAVDVFLDPSAYLSLATSHALRGVLDRLTVVVQASAHHLLRRFGPAFARHPSYRDVLIEAAVAANAALVAHMLRKELGGAGEAPRILYGVYLLETRRIWAPRSGSRKVDGLAESPRSPADFAGFRDALLRSARIAALATREASK
jgi:carbonic anhydrase